MISRNYTRVFVLCIAIAIVTCHASKQCAIDEECLSFQFCDQQNNACSMCGSEEASLKRCVQVSHALQTVQHRSLQQSSTGYFTNSKGQQISCSDTSNGGQTGCTACKLYYGSTLVCTAAAPGYFVINRKAYSCQDDTMGGEAGCGLCSAVITNGYFNVVCSGAVPGYFIFNNQPVACGDTENGGLANCKTCTVLPSAASLASSTPSNQYGVYGVAVACTASDYKGTFINSKGLTVACRDSQQGGIVGCIQCTQSAPGATPTCTAPAVGFFLKNNNVYSCSDVSNGGQKGCLYCTYKSSQFQCQTTPPYAAMNQLEELQTQQHHTHSIKVAQKP